MGGATVNLGATIPLSPQGVNSRTNTPVETWTGSTGKQSYTYVVEKNATMSFTWAFQRTPYHEAVRAGGPCFGRAGGPPLWKASGSRGGDGDGALGARAGGSPVMWPSCTVSTSPTCRGAWPPSAAAVPPSPPGPAPRVPLAVLWTPARAPASPARLAPTCGVTPPTRHPPATPAALAHAATR